MARKVRTNFLYVVFSLFFCAYLSHHYLHRHRPLSVVPTTLIASLTNDQHQHLRLLPQPPTTDTTSSSSSSGYNLQAIRENLTTQKIPPQAGVGLPPKHTVSILLPDWEVLVIVSPEDTPHLRSSSSSVPDDDEYHCLFPNNDVSPAKPSGVLPFPDRATFKCILPNRIRRRLPFPNPVLTRNPAKPPDLSGSRGPPAEMVRWTNVVYDSLTTEEGDVVVLAKGLNHRQGVNRDPSEFNCVFYRGDDVANGVRTAVTHSMQEVFRCKRPEMEASPPGGREGILKLVPAIKVTVETVQGKLAVPSVAYYDPSVRKLGNQKEKALLCACTMVYNVAKFLKEWVMYHSRLGVQTFVLYDNGSDDDLQGVVGELVRDGYEVRTYFWLWPKAQEAGFSHSSVYLKSACAWTAYLDVDEFIYSPDWSNYEAPSDSMLRSLLSQSPDENENENHGLSLSLGEVHIECREFGPSDQAEHPPGGVTQGYNCRKRGENRHKSIVFLEAVDDSLLNAIHHFSLRPGYFGGKMSVRRMVVNHYKFQAWPEFKAKFRRRVSAYVVDWTRQMNPNSNDRTPGLGFEAVEPEGWAQKFCEVRDDGLKELTLKWFAIDSPSGHKLAWQS